MDPKHSESVQDQVTEEVITDGQITDGEPQTPLKKEEEQTEQTHVETETEVAEPEKSAESEKTPISVQQRIDRMYARLQAERDKRLAAEAKNVTPSSDEDSLDDSDGPKPLTQADVEAVYARKEREKRFIASERSVLERHPDALNEDGTFNMDSPFVQKYIEIGKTNPELAMMEKGPELAEAMAEKELGLDYKKGRVAEAKRSVIVGNATTGVSTTAPKQTVKVTLTADEERVAKRMGLTPQEYANYKKRGPVA